MEKLKTTISIEDFYKSDMTLMSLPNDEPLFTLIQKIINYIQCFYYKNEH